VKHFVKNLDYYLDFYTPMKLYIEQKPKLKLEQKLVVSQVQIQILISPVDELNVMLEKEINENPFLEYEEGNYEEKNLEDENYEEENKEKSIREESFEDLREKEYHEDEQHHFLDSTEDQKYERYSQDNTYVAGEYPYESIKQRIFSHFEDEKRRMIALEIFDSIDFKGYLARDVSEILKSLEEIGLNVSEEEFESVRRELITSIEPFGMGSKNTSEYIYFVLKKIADENGIQDQLSPNIIDDIKRKYPEIFEFFEKVSVSGKDIKDAVLNKIKQDEVISKIIDIAKDKDIPPFPTSRINFSEPSIYRKSPDLEVEVYDDNNVYIHLSSPKIYIKDLRKEDWYRGINLDDPSKKIVQEKIRRAREIERGLRMRNDILLKVAKCIFSYQIDFLRNGKKKDIKPLTLEKLSELCGISTSMISRAIRGKTVKTPSGTFELREFLSHSISGEEKKVSQKTILEEINNLISNEDKSKPLSDSEIVRLIKEKFGVDIARRTIVKYRKKLGIANVEERKSMYEKLFKIK